MRKKFFGFLPKKESAAKTNYHAAELSEKEMMGVEGASSAYLEHFYEQDKVKGVLDPIYQKAF